LCHLAGSEVRDLVVAALEQARVRYQFRVYGFVVMLEHVHLLISEPDRATIANAIQSLKIASSMRSAGFRAGGPGLRGEAEGGRRPLWQKRYYDRNVQDYPEFVDKLRYIHRNPVKRGLCARPEDWQWSSFRHYATGEDCGVEIESQWTANKRSGRKPGIMLSPHLGLKP
jgi:putative transposase